MSSTPESSTTSLVKKVRAPVLTEKYSKFIQFSYYIMSQMETDNFTKEEFLNNVKMFDTVEEQQTFIQGFFDRINIMYAITHFSNGKTYSVMSKALVYF